PPLTTIAQPAEAFGRHAVEMLVAQFEQRTLDTPHLILPYSLVVRGSTAAAPRCPGCTSLLASCASTEGADSRRPLQPPTDIPSPGVKHKRQRTDNPDARRSGRTSRLRGLSPVSSRLRMKQCTKCRYHPLQTEAFAVQLIDNRALINDALS